MTHRFHRRTVHHYLFGVALLSLVVKRVATFAWDFRRALSFLCQGIFSE